jgi:hypothetical protein
MVCLAGEADISQLMISAQSVGLSASQGALYSALFNITSGIGRIAFGFLADAFLGVGISDTAELTVEPQLLDFGACHYRTQFFADLAECYRSRSDYRVRMIQFLSIRNANYSAL